MSAITNRRKALPWILGVGILAVSLVAANRMVGTAEAQTAADGKAAKGLPSGGLGGLTILGSVDAVPGVVRVDPPAIAGVLSVHEVLVEEGKVVAVGDPLIRFDDELFRHGLAQAEAGRTAAKWQHDKAVAAQKDHAQLLKKQQLAVTVARFKWEKAKEARDRGNETFERALAEDRNLATGAYLTDAEKARRRKENQELMRADLLVDLAKFDWDKEQIDLDRLTAAPIDADPNAAAAEVARLTAKVAELQATVDACTVTATVAGTIEQVLATPGMLFGPGTRVAAMQIVPSGGRIVRAEVESEFVARVADKAGKKVTITDSHHFGNTYDGVVVRVGTSLLPKRGAGDLLAGPPAKVLECLIQVIDPNPPGKPPLVVGQPVRVVFAQ
jgi:multidrug resistance efflux pump